MTIFLNVFISIIFNFTVNIVICSTVVIPFTYINNCVLCCIPHTNLEIIAAILKQNGISFANKTYENEIKMDFGGNWKRQSQIEIITSSLFLRSVQDALFLL